MAQVRKFRWFDCCTDVVQSKPSLGCRELSRSYSREWNAAWPVIPVVRSSVSGFAKVYGLAKLRRAASASTLCASRLRVGPYTLVGNAEAIAVAIAFGLLSIFPNPCLFLNLNIPHRLAFQHVKSLHPSSGNLLFVCEML